ncbi:hypothetical protein [Cutibacterium avidum]|uniref:hypothetical protein n=1 Tax=Cutibacterium avidum TaxID=33010 RepID=UPI002FEEA869
MRHDVRAILAHLCHRPHLVVRITVLLAWTHVLMVSLHLTGRAAPAILPVHGLSQPVALVDDWWWVSVHGTAAVILAIAAIRASHLWGIAGASLSAAAWAVWSALDLAWSVDTRPPASLAAPMLGLLVCTPLALLTAAAWSEHDLT